jgi:hypothetical protein
MSNQPSATYRQHHDVEAPAVNVRAFRQGWLVHTRLDALRRDGRLTAGEWQVAVEYREAWERVLVATNSNSALGVVVVSGAGGRGADRLAAVADHLTRLRETEAAIGRFAFALCFACAVRDISWIELGRQLHRDRETARDYTAAAFRRLALAWSAPPGGRARRLAADSGQRPPGL